MMEKIRTFVSAHKKAVRIGAAVLAVAVGGGVFAAVRLSRTNAAPAQEDISYSRTVKLEKGALAQTVNVSGVVQSGSVSSVAPALTGKIISVSVKVGDKVKKGDVIAVQDTGDVDKEIAERQTALKEEQKSLQDAAAKLSAQLTEAKNGKTSLAKEQDTLVGAAAAARDNAKSALDSIAPTMSGAQREYDLMTAAVKPAQDAYTAAEAARQAAYEAWLAAGGRQTDSSGAPDPLYTAYQAAEQTAASRLNDLSDAKTLYSADRYTTAYTTVKADYDARRAALDTAQSSYDSAVSARQKALDESDRAISDLVTQLSAAQDKVKKGASSKELDELRKKKESAILRAETDGEVTELKAVVGSVPKDTVATVQSTDSLVLAVKVAEYDINRISVGLAARITSDSIRTPAAGTLSRISPTADSADASSAGFSADITITAPAGLHIGSKAKAEIVLSSKDNVLLAPIDAVGSDASGAQFVKLVENGAIRQVPVTTGEKNDYYLEVSGPDIAEGSEILANADWTALAANAAADQQNAYGGM